jgi:uncharacterized protein
MNMLSQGALTDDEIKEIDQFLLDAEGIEESMDISTLDGFLTAIVCGPKTIMPSEWMRWVWDPIPILDEWCSGFMKGVQLDSEGWLPVIAGKPDWMSTILLYGTQEGWDALKKKSLSLDEHKALAEGLAGTVRKIHAMETQADCIERQANAQ